MYHLKMHTTALHIEADCDWDAPPSDHTYKDGNITCTSYWIKCSKYPAKEGRYCEFENDGWTMDVEDFQKKWGVVKLYRLGKSHCSAGYTDRLNPEKSWFGHNPETLKKYEQWKMELDDEV